MPELYTESAEVATANPWIYKGEPVLEAPAKMIGFIYMITQKSTGKRYIGRKMLTKSKTKQVKGVKKKTRVESDWADYWSSSPTLLALVESVGQDDFIREILVFASTKGSIAYLEEMALHMAGALESTEWINENIRARIYGSWVRENEAAELRGVLFSNNLVRGQSSLVDSE